MDEFPGLLARDFGFRPQGKSAPMSASKASAGGGGGGGGGGGIGSGRSSAPAPSWNRSRSEWSTGDSLLGGGISGDRSPPGYDDVFGGPPTYSNPSSHGRSASPSAPPFDPIFEGFKDTAPKNTSLPVYDKPVYDDDIFDGVPGMKNPASGNYDDIFATMSSASNHASPPPYDDLLENLGRTMPEPKGSVEKRPKEQDLSGFEELIPGFGGSSPPQQREPPETKQQSAASSAKPTAEDLFTSTSAYSSSGIFTDPLEHITRPMNSGNPKNDASPVSGGLFDDDELTKSVPLFTSKINDNPKDKSPLKTKKEPSQRSSMETFENIMPKLHPTKSSDSLKTVDRSVQNSDTSASTYERNAMADQSPESYEHLEAADDVWLTVSEIPLFTQPTSAPPPSRLPPSVAIKQVPFGKTDQFSSVGLNSKRKDNESSSQSSQIYQHMKNSVKKMGASPIDELEDIFLGKPQRYANEHAEVPISEEEIETNSAAAAMKEAMDRAEAKFKHAREVRERERDAKSAKSRELAQQERVEKAIPDAHDPEEDEEKQDILDREREQREKEEKEEKKRREKEREQELERERERDRERERARQAVERATREARERAAAEARLKAERAAVEKANAEARQRAERAAVQRAAAEARERASAEAREKAERERVAAEARERERERSAARERASAEKAAVERAATEARLRAQRAAVERAAAEARDRAAAEAQKRAAAAAASAREKQQKAENDLESFFNMGARPSSAPKQRNPTSEAVFDAQFQSKGFSDVAQRTSPAPSSSIRKTQSTTNIVDDLAFIFGAPSPSGEFQEVEGESEERRRARLERHQRTLERAAKALAEKNERDMQAQRDQAERHRIAETLDSEIKRWAAGKESNLRALLSTLQYVLWPECGWQPVSLTDLITGASVKKVYRKATLCIHPDKVQQKGASLQQKYIAEKVFDLLKEAWNKFNSEELF